jgi:hypothetical protein
MSESSRAIREHAKPIHGQHGASSRAGKFHYLQPEVESSLFRNGKVFTRRDADGSDGGREGVHLCVREMQVHDARQLIKSERRTVERHGFEVIGAPLTDENLDFFAHDAVVRDYYPQCANLVQTAIGAAQVFAFDHNIRSAEGKSSKARIKGGQEVQGPAHVVHGDYTLTSALQRLRDLAAPPTKNDTLFHVLDGEPLVDPGAVTAVEQGARFSIINVWRNIANQPVVTHPLALCDAQSVQPADLVVFEIHYADRVGENYFAKHADHHDWYFYPQMTRDEAMLIKQWDSAGPFAQSNGKQGDDADGTAPCTFSFHSAFEDPTTLANAPERWSIEVRCIAIYT